jgi:hypothetical protein
MHETHLLSSKLLHGIWQLFLNLNTGNFYNNAQENIVDVGQNSLSYILMSIWVSSQCELLGSATYLVHGM